MAKWYGAIGFAESMTEVEPGVWDSPIVERNYYGDIVTNRWKHQNSGEVNDNINISNDISIVADPYATSHCANMVYAEFMGTRWKITNIEVQYPRLVLSIGDVWNGNKT